METDMLNKVVPISKNVVEMLQNRLEHVEDSASQLTKEIVSARQNGSSDRLSLLLSKTQSMESAVQSLKLNFINLSTLTRQPSDLEQKLVEMSDVYSEEIRRLSSENVHLKKDKEEMVDKQQELQVELQRMKLNLEQARSVQTERDEAVLAERSRCESLIKNVAKLDMQLSEERQLRFRLESDNDNLGQRLDEMELSLKQEHMQTQNFTGDFIKVKADLKKKCDEVKNEKNKLKMMEKEMITVCRELERKLDELDVARKEKENMSADVANLHQQYGELNVQLEAMQELFDSHQASSLSSQAAMEKLEKKVEELETTNSELRQKLVRAEKNDESARLIQVRQQLRTSNKECDELRVANEQLQGELMALQERCEKSESQLNGLKKAADEDSESQHAMIGDLQQRLSCLKSELLSLEGEKENLLDEVNGAVDAMDDERVALKSQLESSEEKLALVCEQLAAERERSKELEDKLTAQTDSLHHSRRLTELTNEKNSLSYENGKLEMQLSQLRDELQEMADGQRKLDKVNKKLSSSEKETRKLKAELETCKHAVVQSELTAQQLRVMLESKEKERQEAALCTEETSADAQALAARIETLEAALEGQERARSEVEEGLREDNSKVTESLENLMALHTELQCKYESMQITLGKKDTRINKLVEHRKNLEGTIAKLERQLQDASKTLTDLERAQANQAKVRENHKSVKMDNSKLVRTLQDALDSNERLKAKVSDLEVTLSKVKSENDTLTNKSVQSDTERKLQQASYTDRISELEAQVASEWDKAHKHVQAKSSELQLVSEENESLRAELEKKEESLKQINSQLNRTSRRLTKLKRTDKEAEALTLKNQELSSRCASQEEIITRFVSQFQDVQKEMKELVHAHSHQAEVLADKEQQLETEQTRTADLEAKHKACSEQVLSLETLLQTAQSQLLQANNDTQMATEMLEDTNNRFKEKFSSLVQELSLSKRQQLDLEWRNLEKQQQLTFERMRAEDSVTRATDMMKASRHQLTNLVDKVHFDISTPRCSKANSGSITGKGDSPLHALSVSQSNILSDKDLHSSLPSPFSSSSQKLEAIIYDMERRQLI